MSDSLISRAGNQVILDILETWPSEIKKIIEKNRSLLNDYLKFENKVDMDAVENVEPLSRRPKNPFFSHWIDAIESIESVLENCNFLGFHCTNLIEYEIKDLQNTGLVPLEGEWFLNRINRAHDKHILSDEIYSYLQSNNLSGQRNREDRAFFILSSKGLKSQGLFNLLHYWGGEAAHFGKPISVKDDLTQIGIPTIALSSLTYSDLSCFFPPLAERFIKIYLNPEMPSNHYDSDIEVNHIVDVIGTITARDDLFWELTE